MIGLLADLLSSSRKIIEETLFRVRKLEIDAARTKTPPDA